MVKINFHQIENNEAFGEREIVFPVQGKWFRMKWNNVPEKYKQLYVVYLKLQGIPIPAWLKKYETKITSVDDTTIEIDLTKCEEITKEYPIR